MTSSAPTGHSTRATTHQPSLPDLVRHRRNSPVGHAAALRQLANRLVGILHGCLKTRTLDNEATAWPTTTNEDQQIAA
jgi:hypothetical protein